MVAYLRQLTRRSNICKIFVGGGTTVIDDPDETNPYPKYITTNVVVNDLLKKDTPMEVSGTLIVVGGHLVKQVC